jgi:transposase-like protein
VVPAGHKLKAVKSKAPTCTEAGYEAHYECESCGKLFADQEETQPLNKPVAIAKFGHDMKHVESKKPTHSNDGNKEYYHCNRCGKNFADTDGNTALTDVEIVVPHIGAAVLGEEITEGDFKYKITNPKTDGTGTVTIIGVENENESVTIPSTVELKLDTYKVNRIGPNAFYGNTTIKTLSIGSNVVIIDANAFYGCSNLVKVSGGSRLKTIGTNAFARCLKLSSFTITSSVLSKIGPTAFYKDTKLKTIYIKNTTKLTKAGVKKSVKGSSVKTVKVKKSKLKKYKKYFTKKNAGRKVKVKK